MSSPARSGKICPRCGSANALQATHCARCGAPLETVPETSASSGFAETPELTFVDPSDRVEVARYERSNEAELACGMLRASGIPAQLNSDVIPGLPADQSLWVRKRDFDVARQLLEDAERSSPEE